MKQNNTSFAPSRFRAFAPSRLRAFTPSRLRAFVLSCFLLSAFCLSAQNADALVGTYLKADGKSKIEFFKSGSTYSGKVVWLKEPNDDKGAPKKDIKNPDKSLRARAIMGLVTITGLKYDGEGKYVEGTAYRPTDGDEVKFKVKVNGDGNISVTGTKALIFSKTETWKKQ
jgi:uncharacterized protein (DUF2147 family)